MISRHLITKMVVNKSGNALHAPIATVITDTTTFIIIIIIIKKSVEHLFPLYLKQKKFCPKIFLLLKLDTDGRENVKRTL